MQSDEFEIRDRTEFTSLSSDHYAKLLTNGMALIRNEQIEADFTFEATLLL